LSKHPDVLCSDIIRRKTRAVFQQRKDVLDEEANSPVDDLEAENEVHTAVEMQKPQKSSQALSQLLFIVGHVAS